MVIAILGILLGIVTTAASNSIKQARSRKAEACCRVVQAGFETYYAQKGHWPGGVESTITGDKEYKKGNPCLDISGLFVSRHQGDKNSRDLGMDFMTAIRGTPKEKNGQRMLSSEMHFGYPEPEHGYFRHFKVVYSKPTDQMKVSMQ